MTDIKNTDINDLKQLFQLLDNALESDNPAVRKALKNLLLVSALSDTNNESSKKGILSSLLDELDCIKHRLTVLEVNSVDRDNRYKINPNTGYTPFISYTSGILNE